MWWVLLLGCASAWYLPGMAPTDYAQGDEVPVLVNRLTSENPGGERTVLGYDYYHPHFKFCEPTEGKKPHSGSLGAILFGDRIWTSPFKVNMLEEVECQTVCTKAYDSQDAEFLARRVVLDFHQHWLVDSLPVSGLNGSSNEYFSNIGFPLGEVVEEQPDLDIVSVFNHYDFEIEYHATPSNYYRVVGVSVVPSSRAGSTCVDQYLPDHKPVLLKSDAVNDVPITYSYSVKWVPSDTPWATRWDKYLQVTEARVNWFALVNTTVVVFLLVMLVILSLTRMLRKDIAHYNELDLGAEDIPDDDNGWKMLSGDVFRPPRFRMAYALMIGSGTQILVTMIATLFLAMVGFLSPANRGSFTTVLVVFNTLFGALGGYVSASSYKIWGGERWKVNLLLTPTVIPAIMFAMFLSINMLLVLAHASGAVPIGNMIALLLIWSLVSVPLSFVCGFLAFRGPAPRQPVRVNQIPRQIPPAPWYTSTWGSMLIGGIIPFLAVALQLHYIMTAIWFSRIYYMFGFLFASIAAAVLLSAACSALFLYVSLSAEDHRWQWRSFCVAGSPACYIFAYSCYYLIVHMNLQFTSGRLLYLGYSLMASLLCFLALGSVGALTCYVLVRRIYTSIKMD